MGLSEKQELEQLRAQVQDLEQESVHFQTIFNHVNEAIFIHNVETGKILDVNQAMLDMYQCTREEALACSVEDLSSGITPFDQEHALAKISLALSGIPQTFEWQAKRLSDDEVFWVECSAQVAQLHDQKRLLVTVREISKRKQVQERLSEQNDLMKVILEATQDGIWDIDFSTGKSFSSPQLFTILGYPYEPDAGFEFLFDHMPPETRIKAEQDLKEFLTSGEDHYRLECQVQRADGSYAHILVRGQVMERGAGGHCERMVGSHTDISRRHQLEKERDRLFNLSNELFCIAGFDGYFRQLNPAWSKALGWSTEELLTKPWLHFVHPDDKASTIEIGQELFTGKPIVEFENRYLCKDGSYRRLTWNTTSIRGEEIIFAVARDTTENHEAKLALQESEERFRNIINSSPMGIFFYELRGDDLILLEANPAADRLTKTQLSERIGKTIEEAFPNLAGTEIPKRYKAAAHDGESWQTTSFFYQDDEIAGAYDIHAFQTSTDKMAVMFQDVTERIQHDEAMKQKNNELREARQLLLTAIENSPVGIIIADAPDGSIRLANSAALDIRGNTTDPLTKIGYEDHPMNWQIFLPNSKPSRAEDLPLSRAILKGEMSKNVELIIRRDASDDRLVLANAAPIRNDDGKVIAGIAVFADVTEIKEAEKALRESQENLQITLNSIGDAVIATSPDGSITRMNPVAERLTGWSIGEARERPLSEVFQIVNSLSEESIEDPVQRVMASGKIVGLANHTTLISRDGNRYEIADSGAPIRNIDDEIVGVVLVFRDVTDEHALQEQLRHAQKMDSVGQLAGGIAHDFNNMLSGILGAAELLEGHCGSEERSERLVNIIIDTTNRAAELTQQLLSFSRKGRVRTVAVDFNTVIRNACDILSHTIDRRIEVIQELDNSLAIVSGDPSQLQNAIINLGINARDAMPEGGVIRLSSQNVTLDSDFCKQHLSAISEGKYVKMIIQDTGHGIPEDKLNLIFEPFFTTKEIGKGTGLGLAAVYGTIKEHGGAILVESKVDIGTRFTIYLPVTEESKEGIVSPVAEADLIQPGKGTVLLVEDEVVLQTVARELISELGYDVIVAGDGSEGVQIYRDRKDEIDVIILDLVMPKMNGQEAFVELQAIDPTVKVILASGFNLHGQDADQLLKMGALEFIQKPYRYAELSSSIHNALIGSGSTL